MDNPLKQNDPQGLEEDWKKRIRSSFDEIRTVDIETIKHQWTAVHPKNMKRFINWKNDEIEGGMTVLHCAIWYGRLDIAKLLLEHGADPNIGDKKGWTALMYACFRGDNYMVKLLLDKRADHTIADSFGATSLIMASSKGYSKIVELLLNKGANIRIATKKGSTALLHASREGHTDTVVLLLEKGANLTIANKDGDTALTCASQHGHAKIVKLLLEKGANLNIANKNGETALMKASGPRGHTKIVEILLEKGADIQIANKNGNTALSMATFWRQTKVVDLLLAKIATDPNMCNSNGQTLLHLACLHNKKANAKQMLEIGTDKDKIDYNGHTALFYAAEKGFADIVEWLMTQNADVDKTDERQLVEAKDKWGRFYSCYRVKDGRTPLFIAAQNGHQDVVAILLQYGADPYLCNNESQIPRDVSGVHGPVQQLFRIHDYFDQRELGDAYNTEYRTCKDDNHVSTKYKKPISPLADIIHDVVKYPHFAGKFLELYQENKEIVNMLDEDGRPVRQVACKECREVVLFLRQYDVDDKPIYESPTCKIYNALDYGGPDEPSLKQPRRVAMKFFATEEHFENEMGARRKGDGSPRFSSEFVIPHLAAYRGDQDEAYAKACRTWKSNELLFGFCVVMELGERSLLEAMNAENLSAKHKDLERRDILQKLCRIFSYLHGMGYVHGDIKPHNVVRHIGGNVTWKAIDFDACTKIGNAVGLKLTTGSAPPEMVKIIKIEDADTELMVESEVILRQPRGGLDESELVLADFSFDVWSYGILMYQLVTGRSFFHCDLQGNVDDAGLQDLAMLTDRRINEKLRTVEDVNARILLSRILRLDPKDRPTMAEVGQDYYFHPSESPQGRKADFFGKQVFSIFVPHIDAVKFDDRYKSEVTQSTFKANETRDGEKDEDCDDTVEELESFLSSKYEFSYFKLRDEDKDWSDKLLNSEIETFRFDKLEGMGEKPRLIDGDTIFQNAFLRGLLRNKGPDYFMGFLVEFFELYRIMNDAHEVCQGIKANLVSDVKNLKGIFIKVFVRGKGLNDIVRGTLFCNSIDQFKYVGRQLREQCGYCVYMKSPKKEAGAWPIPKLLIYGKKRIDGRCMSVEIQFSTVYMHLAVHASNNHLVYEAMRESTGYLVNKDKDFQEFLQSLNQQYIDTEGFLRNENAQQGRFEILVNNVQDENDSDEIHREEADLQYTTKATGLISSGRIRCGDQRFQFMSSKDHLQKFSESSFVVNKSLTLLSSHSYWSDESYDLEGKRVEFVVSFKGRGLAIAGIGTAKCMEGTRETDGGGARCSVHVGRSKFVVRKSGVEVVSREQKLPDQDRAKIIFKMKVDGALSVSFVGPEIEGGDELQSGQVSMPPDQRYYLYMRAPPGVHDVKFHDINLI